MDKLDGIRLKLKRAWDEISGLKADVLGYLRGEPTPYVPRINFDKHTHEVLASVHVQKFPDPMWGIRAGEIVHNLRSSLDHAVWELITVERLRSKTRPLTQFPIFETKAGFEDRGVKKFLRGCGANAISLIKSEQPFPQEDGGTGEGAKSPLWHLKELSDADKHRTIHVTGMLVHTFHFSFPPLKRNVVVHEFKRTEAGTIQQDTILARAFFPGVTEWPFREANVNCTLGTDIAFDDGTPAVGGWLMVDTLIDIANRTERILSRIAREIFKTEL